MFPAPTHFSLFRPPVETHSHNVRTNIRHKTTSSLNQHHVRRKVAICHPEAIRQGSPKDLNQTPCVQTVRPPPTRHPAHFVPFPPPKTKNPLNLRVGRISLLSFYLQIRPSPSCVWVPKTKPVRISAIFHARSVCPPSPHFNDYFPVRTDRRFDPPRSQGRRSNSTTTGIYLQGKQSVLSWVVILRRQPRRLVRSLRSHRSRLGVLCVSGKLLLQKVTRK